MEMVVAGQQSHDACSLNLHLILTTVMKAFMASQN